MADMTVAEAKRMDEPDALEAEIKRRLKRCGWGDLDFDDEWGGAYAEATKRNRRGNATDTYCLHRKSKEIALADLVERVDAMESKQ